MLKWNVYNLGETDKKTFNDIFNAVTDAIKRRNLDAMLIILAGVADGAVMLAACAGSLAVKYGVHCGEIVKAASVMVAGSGGGFRRPVAAGRRQGPGKTRRSACRGNAPDCRKSERAS